MQYGQQMNAQQAPHYNQAMQQAAQQAWLPEIKCGSLHKTINNENKLEDTNMVTEVVKDTKQFIRDHKATIYWVAILLLADHFLFNGVFKEKLKNIMHNLVGKVEAKLNDTKV